MEQAISNFLDNKLAAAQAPQDPGVDHSGSTAFSDVNLTMAAEVSAKQGKRKLRTREKIEKMCDDGAKNYPAYLKLVHTGDSDFSDEETVTERLKSKLDAAEGSQNDESAAAERVPKKEGTRLIENKLKQLKMKDKILNKKQSMDLKIEDCGREKLGQTPEKEKSWSTPNTPYGFRSWHETDSFYDTIGDTMTSPEYDNAVNNSLPGTPVDPEERERQEREWKDELAKLEDEISTLRQVLSNKVRAAGDLKSRKLGITPMVELKQDLRQGLSNIKESDAYQKTNQTLKNVGQKTTSAFSTIGTFTSRKFGDMRNSTAFKSFEEKVGGAVSGVKQSRSIGNLKSKMSRVRGSKSEHNFEDVLNSTPGSADAASAPTTPSLEEKLPL